MAEYYIKPSGTDGDGSSGNEFTLFSSAVAALAPGDKLILRNGTYTPSTNGRPIIIGGSTAANGTSGSPIVVEAENERQAIFASDGLNVGWQIEDLAYWHFLGLSAHSADTSSGSSTANIFDVRRSSHLRFEYCLGWKTNRWKNAHIFQLLGVSGSVFIGNEGYDYHRHFFMDRGISAFPANSNIFRLNYGNNRAWSRVSSPPEGSGWLNSPNHPITFYPGGSGLQSSHNRVYNFLAEDDPTVYSPNPNSSFSAQANGIVEDNIHKGCIALNTLRGWSPTTTGTGSGFQMKDNQFVDSLFLNNKSHGARLWWSFGTIMKNVTIAGAGSHGIRLEQNGSPGPGTFNWTGENIASIDNIGAGISVGSGISWTNDYFGNHGNGAASTAGSTNVVTEAPNLGGTLVWTRPISPYFEAGKGAGEHIGAEILYVLDESGNKTSTPLWNPSTGVWDHAGALVSGVNDVAGASLINIHERLGISPSTLPADYGGGGGPGGDLDFHHRFETGVPDGMSTTTSGTGAGISHDTPGLLGSEGKARIDFQDGTTSAILTRAFDLSAKTVFRAHVACDLVFSTSSGVSYRLIHIGDGATPLCFVQHLFDTGSGEERIRCAFVDDGGTQRFSGQVNITTNRPTAIELKFTKSTGSSNADAVLEMFLTGPTYNPETVIASVTGFISWNRWTSGNTLRAGVQNTNFSGISASHIFVDEIAGNSTGVLIGPMDFSGSELPPVTEPDPPILELIALAPRKLRYRIIETDDGGAEITHYNIYRRSPADAGDYLLVDTVNYAGEETIYIATDADPETEYQSVVEAVNSEGASGPSNAETVTTSVVVDVLYSFEEGLHGFTPVLTGAGSQDVTQVSPGLLGTNGKVRIDFDEQTTAAYLPVPVDMSTSDEFVFHVATDLVFQTSSGVSYRPLQVRAGAAIEDILCICQHFYNTDESYERIRFSMYGDDNQIVFSGEVNITTEGRPEWIEVRLKKSSGPSTPDGRLDAFFGGGDYDHTEPVMSITGMTTWDRWRADNAVWMGFFNISALTGISPSHFFLDELGINNLGEPIGPLGEDEPGAALAQQRHWHAMIHG